MDDTKRLARSAGILYGLDALIASTAFLFDPGKFASATRMAGAAEHILAAQPAIRLDMLSEATYQTVEVFLAIQLYRLLKPASAGLAWQMLALALIPIPIVFFNLMEEVAALMFAGDRFAAAAFSAPQRDAVAGLLIRLHAQGLDVAGIFWGLWLFPLGLLIVRCGFIPRIFGVFSIVGGVGWLLGSGASLIMPGLVADWVAASCSRIAMLLEIGEVPTILWLLIWGARAPGNSLCSDDGSEGKEGLLF